MATKIGGFTKSGVVQCVKLVEESAADLSSSYDAVNNSGVWTCENGITFQVQHNGGGQWNDYPANTGLAYRLQSLSLRTQSGELCKWTFNDQTSATMTITNSSDWNSNEALTITEMVASVGAMPPGNVRCVINIGQSSYTYLGSDFNSTTTLSPTSGTFSLQTSDRYSPLTVRMGKDGTLKCKELIEEATTSKISNFNGVWDSSTGTATLNNGWTLKFEYMPSNTYVPITNLTKFTMVGSSGLICAFTISNTKITASEGSYFQNNSVQLREIQITTSSSLSGIANRCTISGLTNEEEIYISPTSSQTSLPYVSGSANGPYIPLTDRSKNLIDNFACTRNSSGTRLIADNGYQFYLKNTSGAEITFPPAFTNLIFSGGAAGKGHHEVLYLTGSGSTASVASSTELAEEWLTVTSDIYIDTIQLLQSGLVADTTFVFVTPDGKETEFPQTSVGNWSLGTGTTSNAVIPYKYRVEPTTVRIFKDGTIKCAEVEEATKTLVSFGQATQTDGLAQYKFENGLTFTIKQESDNSIKTFTTNAATSFYFYPEYTSSGSSSGTSYGNVVSTSAGKWTESFTDEYFQESLIINCVSMANPYVSWSPGTYLEVTDEEGSVLGRLSIYSNVILSSNFGPNSDSDTPLVIPWTKRYTVSWPGSTPESPIDPTQNNFLTSDSGPLITSDGQEFIVQEGGGNS